MNPSLPDPADSPPRTTPKILFSSRTHSQLSQVLAELRKTTFGGESGQKAAYDPPSLPLLEEGGGGGASVDEEAKREALRRPVRALALGSRRNLCINKAVVAPSAAAASNSSSSSSSNGIDERCLDLLSTAHGCAFLPSAGSGGSGGGGGLAQTEVGRAFVDGAFAAVRDIEDLRAFGHEKGCCPYYGSRALIDHAEVGIPVSLPPLSFSRRGRPPFLLSLFRFLSLSRRTSARTAVRSLAHAVPSPPLPRLLSRRNAHKPSPAL
jgi:chromosome transmission fidelity protein 1